jgi:hypothetical protein
MDRPPPSPLLCSEVQSRSKSNNGLHVRNTKGTTSPPGTGRLNARGAGLHYSVVGEERHSQGGPQRQRRGCPAKHHHTIMSSPTRCWSIQHEKKSTPQIWQGRVPQQANKQTASLEGLGVKCFFITLTQKTQSSAISSENGHLHLKSTISRLSFWSIQCYLG